MIGGARSEEYPAGCGDFVRPLVTLCGCEEVSVHMRGICCIATSRYPRCFIDPDNRFRELVCAVAAMPRFTLLYQTVFTNTECHTSRLTGPTTIYPSLGLFALEELILVDRGLKT